LALYVSIGYADVRRRIKLLLVDALRTLAHPSGVLFFRLKKVLATLELKWKMPSVDSKNN